MKIFGIFLEKKENFWQFLEKISSFWQFFDIQMAIFRSVRFEHPSFELSESVSMTICGDLMAET